MKFLIIIKNLEKSIIFKIITKKKKKKKNLLIFKNKIKIINILQKKFGNGGIPIIDMKILKISNLFFL
jgi:hypothetical protein